MTAILQEDPPELAALAADVSAGARSHRPSLPREESERAIPVGARRGVRARVVAGLGRHRCDDRASQADAAVGAAAGRASPWASAMALSSPSSGLASRGRADRFGQPAGDAAAVADRDRDRVAADDRRWTRDRSGDFTGRETARVCGRPGDADADLHPAGRRRPDDPALRRARRRSSFSRAGRRTAARSCT